jgi:O-antigen biosynthesis protein
VSKHASGSPRISVVTPLFNCLAATQEMVASLRRTIPKAVSYEIILVDDGSTDGTREWLSGLGEPFRVVLNDRNVGFALLNNDLILMPGWLRPMLNALRFLGRSAGLVGNIQVNAASLEIDHAGIRVNDVNCKPEHDRREPRLARRLFRPAPRVFAVTGACVLVRADTWRLLGGFNEAYVNGCEDVDLCLRAREAGLRNVVALRSRVLHHVSSSPGRNLHNEENTRRLFMRWRYELVLEASRPWTRDYFWRMLEDPRDFPNRPEALFTALYLLHLWRSPPPAAIVAQNRAVDVELARWREMFSD